MNTRHQHVADSLATAIAELDAVLNPWGFVFTSDGIQPSHCGPFACGHYCRDATRIGLSCRNTIDNIYYEHSFITKLPCSEECECFTIRHETLMSALGHSDDCRLICTGETPDAIDARDGGDRVVALIHDLQSIAASVLREPCEEFYSIIRRGWRVYSIT